jgi:D-aminopeptidase
MQHYSWGTSEFDRGPLNRISDVDGVTVGHCTIDTTSHKTGVTVIMPSRNFIFTNKLTAAVHVLNGFGKTTGLVQIDELGNLESPIALTNTLNVGLVHDALVDYAIGESGKAGIRLHSFNPVVGECNDAYLNDIQERIIKRDHVFSAISSASADFAEGDVGAGKGMSCHQLKGGIGSASRRLELDGQPFTLGVLVLSNHGLLRDLRVRGLEMRDLGARGLEPDGQCLGPALADTLADVNAADRGSIIMVVATDIPLSDRQLRRVCRRTGVGLARLGSGMAHGSGEIAIGFSTANPARFDDQQDLRTIQILNEDRLDRLFRATAEATEEAVVNSLLAANRVVGHNGHVRESLTDLLGMMLPSGSQRS